MIGACMRPGAPEMVDVTTADEIDAAVACCRRCPTLTACAGWLDELIAADLRPAGVVAGRVLSRSSSYTPPLKFNRSDVA